MSSIGGDLTGNLSLSPVISVVMAAYNAEKYIKQAIDSVLRQTYKNIELIVANDGSTDSTLDIIMQCQKKDSRIKVLNRRVNKGSSYTRNEAIQCAKGQYVAIFDADDLCVANRLQIQLETMILKEVDVCGSCVEIIEETDKKVGSVQYYELHDQILMHALFNSPFAHSTVMIKTSILSNRKYTEGLSYAEDYDLWTGLLMDGYKFYNIQDPLVMYRVHSSQVSHKISQEQNKLFSNVQDAYIKWFFKKEKINPSLRVALARATDKIEVSLSGENDCMRNLWMTLWKKANELQRDVVRDRLAIFCIRATSGGWSIFLFYMSFMLSGAVRVKYLAVIFILCLFKIKWGTQSYKKIENVYRRLV